MFRSSWITEGSNGKCPGVAASICSPPLYCKFALVSTFEICWFKGKTIVVAECKSVSPPHLPADKEDSSVTQLLGSPARRSPHLENAPCPYFKKTQYVRTICCIIQRSTPTSGEVSNSIQGSIWLIYSLHCYHVTDPVQTLVCHNIIYLSI